MGRRASVVAVAFLVACSNSSPGTPEQPPPSVTRRIDATGGTVTLPGGASVVIPAGALAVPTDVTITERRLSPPRGTLLVGPGYEMHPDIGFATTVTIALPWDPTSVPTDDPGATTIVFRDVGQGPVPFPAEELSSTSVSVATRHFSTYQPVRFSVRGCLPFQHATPAYPWIIDHSELAVPGSDPSGVSRKLVCDGRTYGNPTDVACKCMESSTPNLATYVQKGEPYLTYVHYTPHLSWIFLFHCGWQCSQGGVKFPLPAVLHECEKNDNSTITTCGTWTWNGTGAYDAVWENGATATITVTSWGEGGVAFTREDKTVAFSGSYRGTLGVNRVEGRVTWNGYGSGGWTATW